MDLIAIYLTSKFTTLSNLHRVLVWFSLAIAAIAAGDFIKMVAMRLDTFFDSLLIGYEFYPVSCERIFFRGNVF